MNIICLKERMPGEGRVALTPAQCLEITKLGYQVFMEFGAGEKSGYIDNDYFRIGASVVEMAGIIPFLAASDTVVLKVKQPIEADNVWFNYMRNGTLFAYFHSTGEKGRSTLDKLLKQNITAISYENITSEDDTNPLLIPMSEIAGRLAVEWGVDFVKKSREMVGFGKLTVQCLQMVVVGAGTVGFSAIKKGLQLGFSRISVVEKDSGKEQFLSNHLSEEEMRRIKFFHSGDINYQGLLKRELENSHLLIGAALVPGGRAPTVISAQQVGHMNKGSVIVDVAIDQGGCIECLENKESVFWYENKMFCRVPNMPGSVPLESTPILSSAIFPYLLLVLNNGVEDAFCKSRTLRIGILTHEGAIMNKKAAEYWNEFYTDPDSIFGL